MTACVLIGGQSSRYGRPKALECVGSESLLERTVRIAREITPHVMLAGRPPFELPSHIGDLTLVGDDPPNIGPIGGLAGCLRAVPDSAILLLACDMPALDARLLQQLVHTLSHVPACHLAVVPRTPVRTWDHGSSEWQAHPCAAIYRPGARSIVDHHILMQRHRMLDLIADLQPYVVDVPAEHAHELENLNTPRSE